jgi:hypothetical protein
MTASFPPVGRSSFCDEETRLIGVEKFEDDRPRVPIVDKEFVSGFEDHEFRVV